MEKIYINIYLYKGDIMDIKNMKNIIVLKDLPSNVVEEAFVILKDNVKIHKKKITNIKGKEKEKSSITRKDYKKNTKNNKRNGSNDKNK